VTFNNSNPIFVVSSHFLYVATNPSFVVSFILFYIATNPSSRGLVSLPFHNDICVFPGIWVFVGFNRFLCKQYFNRLGPLIALDSKPRLFFFF
jgi:hypothetical protein